MPNHTIARSLLKGGMYHLPGNFTAPLVLDRNSTNATMFNIIQAMSDVSAMGPTEVGNISLYIIDEVLSLPPNISAAVMELAPALGEIVANTSLLEPLATAEGITVFAPNDAALGAIMSTLGTLNETVITNILANHVVNGSVVYSTDLASGNYTSAGGEPFKFMSNSTGAYVMSANSTAMIVQSDIIIANGVVHVSG